MTTVEDVLDILRGPPPELPAYPHWTVHTVGNRIHGMDLTTDHLNELHDLVHVLVEDGTVIRDPYDRLTAAP